MKPKLPKSVLPFKDVMQEAFNTVMYCTRLREIYHLPEGEYFETERATVGAFVFDLEPEMPQEETDPNA